MAEKYKFNCESLPKRFWEKVAIDDAGCWIWLGCVVNGYGTVRMWEKQRLCHRVVYVALVGVVPEGLELDHLCRVRRCCNPAHLEPVTHAENVRRGFAQKSLLPHYAKRRAQTHCGHGHEFTPDNTYWRKTNQRACKACNRRRQKALYDRNKLRANYPMRS